MADPSKLVPSAARKPPNAGKGRKKGIPNKFTGEVKQMILDALGEAGGVDYLVKQAKNNPGPFLTLVGKVLPLQITGPADGAIVHRIELVGVPST